MDGRIDDPNGGWKGRGLSTFGNRTPFHRRRQGHVAEGGTLSAAARPRAR
jgi:hypothetical protein